MASAIYRKYRPQVFSDVVGQDHVTKTLANEIINDKLAHAYLFCGMRGIGKTTVARILAKAINCEKRTNKTAEPCNNCTSCKSINEGRSLDLLEIDAASNRRIDDIREIKEHIPYGPSQAKYRVVIVDEVHMLTTEAFNALLKTLEEPPPHVLFVLCTTEVHKLPETIISRCQRFDFKRIKSSVLLTRLRYIADQEGVKIEDQFLRQIIEIAGGSSRDAESYLGKLVSLGEKKISSDQAALVLPHSDLNQAADFIEYLISSDTKSAIELINEFLEQGGDIAYFYHEVLDLLRKMLLLKLGGKLAEEVNVDLLPEFQSRLVELSRQLTHNRLQIILERWLGVENSWRSSEIWQLPLELAVVEITAIKSGQSYATTDQIKPEVENNQSKITKNASQNNISDITLEKIIERWPEVVTGLRDYNHSLSFILSVARPLKLEGNTLTVGFSYQLHLERVKEPKIVEVIEQTIEKVFDSKLKLHSETDEVQGSGDLLSNVLTTFGGRVVQ